MTKQMKQTELPITDEQLIAEARKAREFAYAPYSRFPVGAALFAKSGKVYTGCNIENSSYGLSICAERVALFKAVSNGEREFLTIAVVGMDSSPVFPCGACRQVLYEFSPDLTVLTLDNNNVIKHSLKELLPDGFSLQKDKRDE